MAEWKLPVLLHILTLLSIFNTGVHSCHLAHTHGFVPIFTSVFTPVNIAPFAIVFMKRFFLSVQMSFYVDNCA